jgi:hypothetical protein
MSARPRIVRIANRSLAGPCCTTGIKSWNITGHERTFNPVAGGGVSGSFLRSTLPRLAVGKREVDPAAG